MHKLDDLENRLGEELDEIAEKATMTINDVQTVDAITHALKNICKIKECYNSEEDGVESHASSRDSEFAIAAMSVPVTDLVEALDDHFTALKMAYPKEYEAVMQKIAKE